MNPLELRFMIAQEQQDDWLRQAQHDRLARSVRDQATRASPRYALILSRIGWLQRGQRATSVQAAQTCAAAC